MPRPTDSSCVVTTSAGEIAGTLTVPVNANGIVIFAHGSGSSRHSTRNQQVARALQARGFATLLFDLLTPAEEVVDAVSGHLRFDIPLLGRRLVTVTDWVRDQLETSGLRIGYFGASTGAGAALMAAAERPAMVRAIVSRGGRPDLAGDALRGVLAPTLLIVGGLDTEVIRLNELAMAQMTCERRLEIVPRATHLFPSPAHSSGCRSSRKSGSNAICNRRDAQTPLRRIFPVADRATPCSTDCQHTLTEPPPVGLTRRPRPPGNSLEHRQRGPDLPCGRCHVAPDRATRLLAR